MVLFLEGIDHILIALIHSYTRRRRRRRRDGGGGKGE
jgi:hypothetical protein